MESSNYPEYLSNLSKFTAQILQIFPETAIPIILNKLESGSSASESIINSVRIASHSLTEEQITKFKILLFKNLENGNPKTCYAAVLALIDLDVKDQRIIFALEKLKNARGFTSILAKKTLNEITTEQSK